MSSETEVPPWVEQLQWFTCLYGNVRRSACADGSVTRATNRTVIVVTAKPRALLTLMNASEENNIADAADKASKLLNTECEKIYSNVHTGGSDTDRFALLCALGPILSLKQAQEISRKWNKSRGGHPRAVRGQNIGRKYNIDFHIDMEAIYALNNLDVDVQILESDSSGAILEICPKKSL